MLEHELYPTTPETIRVMIRALQKSLHQRQRFLDPSAGDGRILDTLQNAHHINIRSLFACEIQPDLVALLQGKGYAVLERDFLLFDEPIKFDVILANPPFSEAIKHILKMWEILDYDGELVTLLNWKSIRFIESPDETQTITRYQQLLGELVKAHGHIKNLGQCFRYAERRTLVEVGMVYLRKPKQKADIGFDGVNVASEFSQNSAKFAANPLAQADLIKALVAQYQQARRLLIERDKVQSELNFYLRDVPRAIYGGVSQEAEASLHQLIPLDSQISALKFKFWSIIFERTAVGKRATSDFRKKFENFALSNSAMAFTEQNVREVLSVFMQNMSQYMQEAVVSIFDKATAYHENNKVHHEGWKTNKGWKVNYRIIVPGGVTCDRWNDFSPDYNLQGFLNDFDRVLCWISGTDVNDPGFFGRGKRCMITAAIIAAS